MTKESNSSWGLENGILTITAHALTASLINYSLAATGAAATPYLLDSMNVRVSNPVARRVAGAGIPARREVLYTLADLRTTSNHYLLETANVFDRSAPEVGDTKYGTATCPSNRSEDPIG